MKKLSRILCAVLCALLAVNCTVFAAADSAEENAGTESTESTEAKKGLVYDPESAYPVYAGYTPDYSGYNSSQYEFFMELLDVYCETHLFEFTSDEAKEAFIMKLMKENPELMGLFIETLLKTMDPYSGYYEAGYGLANDGAVGGYGIVMGDETNGSIASMGLTAPGLYIVDVTEGSPAQKAGILVGDRIVSVEGTPLEGLTFDAMSYLLKGLPYIPEEEFDELGNSLGIPNEPEFVITNPETGKKTYYLHIEIERAGEIIPVKMIKDRIIYSDIFYERDIKKNFSRIQIASFSNDNCVEDFRKAVERAKKESGGNLLIDLRDNGGGTILYAIEMAEMLIPEKDKVLCYINARELEEPEVILSSGGGYGFEKVTVLVNEYTASAAELFAIMLRYNCGATIVGTTTYGKAVGQTPYELVNGDLITITSMEILDPLKRSYHNIGVVPDIEIDLCLTKFDFPENVGELVFQKTSERDNPDPTNAEEKITVMEFTDGQESENILALEKRFEILGFLRSEKVDGKFDSATLSAIKAFELYIYNEPEGILDEREVRLINSMSEKYRNYYYKFDSQTDVAKMTFHSASQARRRVKELVTESNRVEKEYKAYEQAEKEHIKAEEAEKAKQEAENAASEQPETNTQEQSAQ